MLSRRQVLAASASMIAAPALAKGDARTLRFAPRSDLAILDPLWTSALITRNHAYMVYDTLFGVDAAFQPSPQMLAGTSVADDGLTWRLTLREGQTWHDGERVLARDCVASIRRWGARDSYGQALLAATNELAAPDDRTIVFRLKRPFVYLPNALGKTSSFMPAMMPERLASADPTKPLPETVGSGPFRFAAAQRVPGARAVYERFTAYKPREDGVPSRTAGPKRVHFDRVEWITMPDAGTAAEALQVGEIDWWDYPLVDLLPQLRADPKVTVQLLERNGQYNFFRMNQLIPPFDDPAIRRAMLGVFDQDDFMGAVAGNDHALWRDHVGIFCPGTPLANDAGLAALTTPRDPEAAKRELKASGYEGEPVILLAATDFPALRALAEVAADAMRKAGIAVDYQALDWAGVQQRRVKRGAGGWNAFLSAWDGSDVLDPAGHVMLRGNGAEAWFGWPTDPKLEQLRSAWFEAKDLAQQEAIARAMQREAFVSVPYIPVGQNFQPTAFRSDLKGQLEGFALFWNVRRE